MEISYCDILIAVWDAVSGIWASTFEAKSKVSKIIVYIALAYGQARVCQCLSRAIMLIMLLIV